MDQRRRMGFSGTHKGMTDHQRQSLIYLLRELVPNEFHHGDCIGSDAEAHMLVRDYSPATKIHIHPGHNYSGESPTRARMKGDVWYAPKHYLDRDWDIVIATDYLVATPEKDREVLRSGTWATLRRAKRLSKSYMILSRNSDKIVENF